MPRHRLSEVGCTGLHSVLVVVPDSEVDAHDERYARMLDADVWTDGPKRVLPLRHGRVEIVPHSALDESPGARFAAPQGGPR